MTRAARIVFALLVLATLAAFVVGQRLKSSPPLVVRPWVDRVFSPAAAEPAKRRAKISFWIVRDDRVTVSIVNDQGRIVRTVVDGVELPRRVRRTWWWDGRTDEGAVVPDGAYRVRVALLRQGRTIDLPGVRIAVDTRPPRPRVVALEPAAPAGPAFLPQRGVRAITASVRGTEGRPAELQVWRTDVPTPRIVERIELPARQPQVRWDGTIDGRPAPAGTYLLGLRARDRAGNVATFPRRPPGPGTAVRWRAGVTVRHLAAAPPLEPVPAGARATVLVDARGRPYRWALRRWGQGRVLARGAGRDHRLRVPTPRGQAGLHVLTIASGGHRTRVPIVVGAPVERRVLVVLPALSWQAANPVDDDGDGLPNVLDDRRRDATVRLRRPFAHGLPRSIAAAEGALLRFLDDAMLRYDLTTDAALASGRGPSLDGYRGIVLAGDARWITPAVRAALRARVEAGGRVWSLGVDALRRTVRLRDGMLAHPSAPQATDALGARPRQPLVEPEQPVAIETFRDGPIFDGTSGHFAGYDRYEALASLVPEAELTAAAGPDAQTPVVASWRLGDGVAIRTGLPTLARKAAAGDVDAAALVRAIWAVVAGR